MRLKQLYLIAVCLTLATVAAGVAAATPQWRLPPAASAVGATVSNGISYQGRLSGPGGNALTGTYTMRFIVYDDETAGTALWDSGNLDISVEGGLFHVKLDVDPSSVDGRALWLRVSVNGEVLSPRQEILAAPYAMSLRPGADIVGDAIDAADAILSGYAPATGTALYADANGGAGLVGESEESYGVWGASNNSWGGYFTSSGGYGIRVDTSGTAHNDHGAYITSEGGYAVYAQSANNQGLRGEAGDITGIAMPLGAVGAVGLGENRGVYGASGSGVGVYGTSNGNYAGYFNSGGYRGLYASSPSGYYAGYFSNRGGVTEPGIFVNGTLVATGAKSGYVVDISLNQGPDPLETGDLVAIVGVSDPVVGEIPVMRVARATAETAGAVAGVVDQRFVVEQSDDGRSVMPAQSIPRTADGNAIQPGEYLSVVTLGAFARIKVDAGYGSVQPGDLLTPSPHPGYAMRAVDPAPGTVVGKALETLESGQGTIAVYVTVR